MNYFEESLKLYEEKKGKILIIFKIKVEIRDDLSFVYILGVVELCRKIYEDEENVYKYILKGNLVVVVIDGLVVFGFGDIGLMVGMFVMEGKLILFKEFVNVDVFFILVNLKDVDEIVNIIRLIVLIFGGINLEDIGVLRCFEVEEKLKKLIDILVFYDD